MTKRKLILIIIVSTLITGIIACGGGDGGGGGYDSGIGNNSGNGNNGGNDNGSSNGYNDGNDNNGSSVTVINSASVIVDAPVKATIPNSTANYTGNFTISGVSWSPYNNPFLGGVVYTVTVTLTANSGYIFSGSISATINGQNATTSNNTGSIVKLSYTFPATDTKTVIDMATFNQPTNLIYTHGDLLNLTGLTVMLTYDDATTENVAASSFTTRNITTSPANGNNLVYLTHNGQPVAIKYGNLTQTTNTLSISRKLLTITGVVATNRTYNGSTAVSLSGGSLVGVVSGDSVSFTLGNGTITNASVGNNKVVTTNIQLTGIAAGNYILTQPSGITVDILDSVSESNIEYYWVEQGKLTLTASTANLSRGSSQSVTINSQGTGYSSQRWFINGVEVAGTSNQSQYNFTSVGRPNGTYTVGIMVTKDTILYYAEILITVTN